MAGLASSPMLKVMSMSRLARTPHSCLWTLPPAHVSSHTGNWHSGHVFPLHRARQLQHLGGDLRLGPQTAGCSSKIVSPDVETKIFELIWKIFHAWFDISGCHNTVSYALSVNYLKRQTSSLRTKLIVKIEMRLFACFDITFITVNITDISTQPALWHVDSSVKTGDANMQTQLKEKARSNQEVNIESFSAF